MDMCFADKEKECSALTYKECERHFDWKSKKFKYFECDFYKTQEQALESETKAFDRLRLLPLETRLGIASAYKIEGLE